MAVTLEILTSAFNEEKGIKAFLDEVVKVLDSHPNYSWKIRICDNGSTDSTWEIISTEARLDSRIVAYKMVRSFGFDNAISFALDQATSDVVVTMTSDLQDPPQVISQFIESYEQGNNHVVAQVITRKSISLKRKFLTRTFYFVAGKLTDGMYPNDVSDFRLMSRLVYSDVRKMREQNRFLRGIVAWTGHKYKTVKIERPAREYGVSHFESIKLRKVIPWALSSIFSFTAKPLEFVAFTSMIFSGLTFLFLLILAGFWITSGVPFAGYGTIVGGVMLLFSITLLILGIFSLYLNLIFNEIKGRPLYLVEESTENPK